MSNPKVNLFNLFATDLDKVENGTWVAISPGVSFRLARLNRPEFNAVRNKLMEENSVTFNVLKSTQKHKELEELSSQIFAKVLARAIVKDWKGVTVDGAEVPFTEEACEAILIDPAMVDLVTHIVNLANDRENFRVKGIEEAAKN